MVQVMLPGALRDRTGGLALVEVEGGTAGEVLGRLEARYPALRGWLLDERGRIRDHVKLFVNDTEASLETPLATGDELHIVPAISGG